MMVRVFPQFCQKQIVMTLLLVESARVCALGAAYVLLAACLIVFNKLLMSPDRFPYPVHLSLMHSFFIPLLLCVALFFIPSKFPSLTDKAKREAINVGLILRVMVPIGLMTSILLVLNNAAYLSGCVCMLEAGVFTFHVLCFCFFFFYRHDCKLVALICRSIFAEMKR